jgi:hypothetical protein
VNYTPNHRRIFEYLLKKPFPPHPRFSLPELFKMMDYILVVNYSGVVVNYSGVVVN